MVTNKAKKLNFTAERIAGFTCKPNRKQTIYWDAKTPGFGLRVTAAGSKSYIFESRLHGKTLRITIGSVKTWNLENRWVKDNETGENIIEKYGARQEAQKLKTLTDKGIDPRQLEAEKRAKAEAVKAEENRQSVTFKEVWPFYIKANKSEWGDSHYFDHIKLAAPGGERKKRGKGLTVAGPLASLLHVPLTEFTATKISKWLESESATRPTSTARSYRLLRAFIRWTNEVPEYSGIISHEAYSAKAVKRALPQSKSKDDCLQREQLPAWFDTTRKITNPVISAYLQTLLLTGARREEIAGLLWQDVDFQWRSLTIRDKVEGQRAIPLTPYTANLLNSLPRRNQWVFSSLHSASGRLQEPAIAHRKAVSNAGLPILTLHGLRRSFGTLCEWVEVPSGISAQIMGHKPSAIAEKHYRRRPLDLLRMWHEKIEAWILEQAGVQFEPEQTERGLRIVKH